MAEPPLPAGRRQTSGAPETAALGEQTGAALAPGDVVLVAGEMGAGKTTWIRGACRALGVSEPVTSPTFVLGHRYRGMVPVAHLDLHRIASLDEEDPALLDDYLTPDAVAFVEWPDVARRVLTRVTLSVTLAHAGGDTRWIDIE